MNQDENPNRIENNQIERVEEEKEVIEPHWLEKQVKDDGKMMCIFLIFPLRLIPSDIIQGILNLDLFLNPSIFIAAIEIMGKKMRKKNPG